MVRDRTSDRRPSAQGARRRCSPGSSRRAEVEVMCDKDADALARRHLQGWEVIGGRREKLAAGGRRTTTNDNDRASRGATGKRLSNSKGRLKQRVAEPRKEMAVHRSGNTCASGRIDG